ncbi:MAG TPA: NTPase [Anaerolineae bacterium]|nr:NTPase [Anaerolineae bacterium]
MAKVIDKVFLLTGRPGIGKTTIIQQILHKVPYSKGGFFTQEIREGNKRVGFSIVTLDGQQEVFAHVKFPKKYHIGKYGVDLGVLNSIGVISIRKAMEDNDLVVIDEIGAMELLSVEFVEILKVVLESGVPVLGTIMQRNHPVANWIKSRKDVMLIEVNLQNREKMAIDIIKMLTDAI